MRLDEPTLPAQLVAQHRPGFYLRVITEGHVQAGDEIVRTRTGRHALTVADVDALLYLPNRDRGMLAKAVDLPALSPGWQQSFRELLDVAPAVGPAWPGFRPLRVTDIVAESETIASVHLSADEPLPAPLPGQYLTIRAAGAVRSYSLSSNSYRISVKREPHGVVSGFLHTQLRKGAVLEVAAPRGDFVLAPGTGPVALISAGVGVTPVLAMLHQLAASRSTREVWWLHTTRSSTTHAFLEEARSLLAALPHAHEHIFHTTSRRLDPAALADLALPADATAYVCGPAGFMTDMRAALAPREVHTELFGARGAINPGVTRVEPHGPAAPGTGPRVTFARSGLTVRDSGGTLLELAEACDIPTRWSCRTGVCHTCATPVLSGSVAYVRAPLEDPPPGEALLCCARADTDVVVDL
jgi:ferredoxin-NADP reductase